MIVTGTNLTKLGRFITWAKLFLLNYDGNWTHPGTNLTKLGRFMIVTSTNFTKLGRFITLA